MVSAPAESEANAQDGAGGAGRLAALIIVTELIWLALLGYLLFWLVQLVR